MHALFTQGFQVAYKLEKNVRTGNWWSSWCITSIWDFLPQAFIFLKKCKDFYFLFTYSTVGGPVITASETNAHLSVSSCHYHLLCSQVSLFHLRSQARCPVISIERVSRLQACTTLCNKMSKNGYEWPCLIPQAVTSPVSPCCGCSSPSPVLIASQSRLCSEVHPVAQACTPFQSEASPGTHPSSHKYLTSSVSLSNSCIREDPDLITFWEVLSSITS